MTDKEFNKRAFTNYANNFDRTDFEIEGKYQHSLRVAELCDKIGKKYISTRDLAYNLGLLHDIYRFHQWTDFQSFNDFKTVDHGELACQLLFQTDLLEKFFHIDKRDYACVYFAVKNHNKHTINEKEVYDFCRGKVVYIGGKVARIYYNKNTHEPAEIINAIKLVRDADKIDIIYRLTNETERMLTDKSAGFTQSVYDDFYAGRTPFIKDCQTKLDSLMVKIALLFDINFPESWQFINVSEYLTALWEIYSPQLTKNARDVFKQLLAFGYDKVARDSASPHPC